MTAEYEPLPAILTIEQAIEAGSFLTEELRIVDGDTAALDASPTSRSRAELRIGGQEHFYLETQAALAWIDEAGFIARAFVDAASVRNTGGGRARARRAAQSRDRRVPAHGGRVRRQGSAGQSVRGDCRAWRVEDEAARARQADARARHGDHRQAPSLSCEIRCRVFVGWPFEGACASSCFPTAAGASICPSPSCGARCFMSTTRTSCRPLK